MRNNRIENCGNFQKIGPMTMPRRCRRVRKGKRRSSREPGFDFRSSSRGTREKKEEPDRVSSSDISSRNAKPPFRSSSFPRSSPSSSIHGSTDPFFAISSFPISIILPFLLFFFFFSVHTFFLGGGMIHEELD